ncbi:MAG: deoxyribonuclease IV [Erysipelothrix sp.]|nr:deoxyribonuclease IV [Erysipelothrix sp.]
MLKIGSHVSMSAPHYLLGAIKEALSYGANSLMIYSGAPQNTRRIPTDRFKIEEAQEYMKEVGFDSDNIIMHAPYIINLANTVKPEVFELAHSFLVEEIKRTQAIGSKVLVLHPGSHVKAGDEVGLAQIIKGLDMVIEQVDMKDLKIALETMAGKGSEVGFTFEQIRDIRAGVKDNSSLGVCLDTCHIHDAGYDLSNVDHLLDTFDDIIGLEHLSVIHVNDSKNIKGARKDRHANIGFGEIGFDHLLEVIYHPRLAHLCKILETPYVNKKAPYRHEIDMIKSKEFNPSLLELIEND